MSVSDIVNLVLGTVQGLAAIVIVLLALFIGVTVALTLTKFRWRQTSLVHRNLDDLGATPVRYLRPEDPRGPIDQLNASRHVA